MQFLGFDTGLSSGRQSNKPYRIERTCENNNYPLFDQRYPAAIFSLLGLAIGDSLGAPLEGKKSSTIKAILTGNVYRKEIMPLGLIWTDDTQMALVSIESSLQSGVTRGLNREVIKKLWVDLASDNLIEDCGEKWTVWQYGLWRGTGKSFRDTVNKIRENPTEPDVSTINLGNGAAKRVTPIALSAWNAQINNENERMLLLRHNVLVSSTTTHNSILAISPAFAVAYMLFRWSDPNYKATGNHFIDWNPWKQLDDIANETHKFEEYLYSDPTIKSWFELKNGDNSNNLHVYSTFLKFLSTKLREQDKNRSPERMLTSLVNCIVKFSETQTPKKITSPNDGFALASVSMAIVSALLLKDKGFIEPLLIIFGYGGDTDAVGALVGSLLGAYIGNKNLQSEMIPPHLVNQLASCEKLFEIFNQFIYVVHTTPGVGLPSPASTIDIERDVTLRILHSRGSDRPIHFVNQLKIKPSGEKKEIVIKKKKEIVNEDWNILLHDEKSYLGFTQFLENADLPLLQKSEARIQKMLADVQSKIVAAKISEEIKQKELCVVCMENTRDSVFIPCGHRTCCMECAKRLTICPICRQKCSNVLKVYD